MSRINFSSLQVFWCLFAVPLSCQNKATTDELLNLNISGLNTVSITPVAPTEGALFNSTAITFEWTSPLSLGYIFELARDNSFSNVLVRQNTTSNSYTLKTIDLGSTTLVTGNYYWRVRPAQIASIAATPVRSFALFLLGSTPGGEYLYVSNSNATTIQNGTAIYPYKSISAAIPTANALRGNNPAQPLRLIVSKGTYTEEVSLLAGISIYGGYDSDKPIFGNIAWLRSVADTPTTIQAPGDVAVIAGSDITAAYTSSTIIDGFTIRGGATGISRAMMLNQSRPTIANNILYAGSGPSGRRAIEASQSAPMIQGNTIYGATTSGTGDVNVLLNIQSAAGTVIERNWIVTETVSGYAGTGMSTAIRCFSSCNLSIRNNLFLGGVAANIAFTRSVDGSMTNNTLYHPATPGGSLIQANSSLTFESNNIGAVSGTCVSGAGITSQNNNSFGCTISIGSNNTNIPNTSNQLLMNLNGADNNVFTIADNDWRLTSSGVICDVRVGARNHSATYTNDYNLATRTATNHCGSVLGGATGWSMGAYESD